MAATSKRKKQPPRPVGGLILNGADMVSWVEAHVSQNKRGKQTPFDAACWFAAVTEAEQFEDLSTKDLAEIVLHGLPGFKGLGDLDVFVDGYADNTGTTPGQLAEDMALFWGVPHGG